MLLLCIFVGGGRGLTKVSDEQIKRSAQSNYTVPGFSRRRGIDVVWIEAGKTTPRRRGREAYIPQLIRHCSIVCFVREANFPAERFPESGSHVEGTTL